MMTLEECVALLKLENIVINDDEFSKIYKYSEYLLNYNKKVNLISRKSADRFYSHHLFDSLILMKIKNYSLTNSVCIDLGAGGGLPSIPLAILNQNANFVLVESTKKKAVFLEKAIKEVGLENCKVVHNRFENIVEKADFVLVRAIGKISDVLNLNPKLLSECKFIFYKSKFVEQELETLNSTFSYENYKFEYSFLGQRNIVVVWKKSEPLGN